MPCQHCGSSSGFTYSLKVSTVPRLVYFNTFGFPKMLPSTGFVLHTLQGRSIHYRLGALFYYGSNHFTSQILQQNESVWSYDGMINGGLMNLDTTVNSSNPTTSTHCKQREARTLSHFPYLSSPSR